MPTVDRMTLGEIIDGVFENHERTNDGSHPRFKAKVVSAVNRALFKAAGRHDWKELRRSSALGTRQQGGSVYTLEAGEQYFPAPLAAVRIESIMLTSPGRCELAEIPSEELARYAYSNQGSGAPRYWAHWGKTAQYLPISADVALEAISDSDGNDTANNPLDVEVHYLREGHFEGEVTRTVLAGDFSTGVALPTNVASGWSIMRLALPAGWVGSFQIRETATPANVVASVSGLEYPTTNPTNDALVFEHDLLRLDKPTDVDRSGIITYLASPRRLAEDSDIPELPVAVFLIEEASATLSHGDREAFTRHRGNAEMALRDAIAQQSKTDRGAVPLGHNPLDATGVISWKGRRSGW